VGGCVRGSSHSASQRKAQYGRRRASKPVFRVRRQGRQTRVEADRSTQRNCLPAVMIGGHASTDAEDGSSSEHLLPRRATAACVRVRACVRAGPRHMLQERTIIESAIRHTHACMHAAGAAHRGHNNSTVYCIQRGGSCLGWRLRACTTIMPSPPP
jgi:hypothetical protein